MAEEILIRINLQSGEAKSKIKEIKKATDDYAKSIDNLTKEQLEVLVAEQKVSIQRQITKKQVQELALAQINAANAANKNRAQSGLNNAILLETGRLASDASFGFTAIANNLSQVISLFQSFAKTNGGFIKSLEQLGRSLIGTGGLLIALQLIISFGPKIFKFFKELISGVDVLGEAFKDAGKTVESTAGDFEIYIDKLQDVNSTQEEQRKAVSKLTKEFPEFIANLEEAGVSTEDLKNKTIEASTATNKFRDALLELALANAARTKIQELRGKFLQAEIDATTELLRENMSLEEAKRLSVKMDEIRLKVSEKSFTGQAKFVRDLNTELRLLSKEDRDRIKLADKIIRNLDKEKITFQEQINILMKYTKIQDSTTKNTGKNSTLRVQFQAGELDFQKEILKSQERTLSGFIKNEETRVAQLNTNRILEAKIRLEDFKEKQKDRLQSKIDRIKDSLDTDKITNEERQRRLSKIKIFQQEKNTAIQNAEKSLADFIIQINNETDTRIDQLQNERNIKAAELLTKASAIRQNFELEEDLRSITIEGKRNEVRMMRDQMSLESEKEAIQKRLDLGGLETDEKAKLELEKTKIEEQQSKIRIAIADAEANAKIQGLDVTANALSAFSKLAGEETKAGKFLSIASALISTYLSAQKAFESQFLPIPTKSSPVRGAIAAAAAIASGIANVKAITSVNEKGQSGGGAAQRPSITATAPDFNVVGASQASQLAQSISTQVEKPVKAFVVGKEITSQQELDRNINNTAGI